MARSSTLVNESEAVEDNTGISALEFVSGCFGKVPEHVFSTCDIVDNIGAMSGLTPQRSAIMVNYIDNM